MAIKDIPIKFSKIENQGKKTKLFTLKLEEELNFEPGQFINLIFEDENKNTHMKPYSIASDPSKKNEIQLTINLVDEGKSTPYLFKKKEGDNAFIKGPLGLFKLDENIKKEKITFIGTGTGVAPFRSMIKHLILNESDKQLTLILGIRYENEILFENELKELELNHPNFKFIPVISKPSENWKGRIGYVQNNLDIVDPLNSKFYICGLPKMVEEVQNKLFNKGVLKEEIHFERYV